MIKQEYVVGFLFSEDKSQVALIRKNRPEWQKGFLNGIGGKIEDGETSIEAMVREFTEETGINIHRAFWEHKVTIEFETSIVYFYYSCSDVIKHVKSTTDEQVEIVPVDDLKSYTLIPNLYWLIPLCLDDKIGYARIDGNYYKPEGKRI